MISQEQVAVFILVLARVSAFVAFFPLFAKKQLPVTVKAGLSVALAVFWYGTIDESQWPALVAGSSGVVGSFLMLAREVTIGVVLAVILGMMLLPAKVAGAFVGQEMGLSLASISDPGSQDSSTLLTRLFETFAILIFFSINMHHFMLHVLHFSFENMFHRFDVLAMPTDQLVGITNDVSNLGLLNIAPLIILFMLITLGLAFLNKAAPTMNLFSIGLSIRCGFGIFCMLLFLPVIFSGVRSYMYRMQADIEQLLNTLAN